MLPKQVPLDNNMIDTGTFLVLYATTEGLSFFRRKVTQLRIMQRVMNETIMTIHSNIARISYKYVMNNLLRMVVFVLS